MREITSKQAKVGDTIIIKGTLTRSGGSLGVTGIGAVVHSDGNPVSWLGEAERHGAEVTFEAQPYMLPTAIGSMITVLRTTDGGEMVLTRYSTTVLESWIDDHGRRFTPKGIQRNINDGLWELVVDPEGCHG